MRLKVATLLVFACTLASSACKLVPDACTTEAAPAVSVTVHDSATNALVGRGARIIARNGGFADTADFSNEYDGPYGLAHERTGSYDVTVEQQGYRVWSRSGVNVTRGECHVRTASITARLQP
jgi:starvation-inducible outer membrane lipoprotein